MENSELQSTGVEPPRRITSDLLDEFSHWTRTASMFVTSPEGRAFGEELRCVFQLARLRLQQEATSWAVSRAVIVENGDDEAAQSARRLAATAQTVEALAELVAGFDGCALKRTATNTVFGDGNPTAPVMIIGEAPGADEDRIGRPFVGRAGQLLDSMLATIGLDRTGVMITNVIYWRPPGNRTPTSTEIASCLPFVLRHIMLVGPKVLVLCGGTAAGALLPQSQGIGITRLRGRWFDLSIPGLDRPLPTLPMFHPSFLLRVPERKTEARHDMLALRARLDAEA